VNLIGQKVWVNNPYFFCC